MLIVMISVVIFFCRCGWHGVKRSTIQSLIHSVITLWESRYRANCVKMCQLM